MFRVISEKKCFQNFSRVSLFFLIKIFFWWTLVETQPTLWRIITEESLAASMLRSVCDTYSETAPILLVNLFFNFVKQSCTYIYKCCCFFHGVCCSFPTRLVQNLSWWSPVLLLLFFSLFCPYFSTLSCIPPGFLQTVATIQEQNKAGNARAGWNLPNSKVNLQYVSSDAVSVMKSFLQKKCVLC